MARIFSQSFIGVEWTWSAGDPTPPYSGMQQNGSGSDAYEASYWREQVTQRILGVLAATA